MVDIAKKLNKDPAQVLISWAVQRGSAVLPKSVTSSRIESNFQGICEINVSVFAVLMPAIDFVIPDAEFEAINKLDRNERYNYPFRWGVDLFGELGAAEAERRAEEHAVKLRKSD